MGRKQYKGRVTRYPFYLDGDTFRELSKVELADIACSYAMMVFGEDCDLRAELMRERDTLTTNGCVS
jgi:hypothetical protein